MSSIHVLSIVHFVRAAQHKRSIMLTNFMAPWCIDLILNNVMSMSHLVTLVMDLLDGTLEV